VQRELTKKQTKQIKLKQKYFKHACETDFIAYFLNGKFRESFKV